MKKFFGRGGDEKAKDSAASPASPNITPKKTDSSSIAENSMTATGTSADSNIAALENPSPASNPAPANTEKVISNESEQIKPVHEIKMHSPGSPSPSIMLDAADSGEVVGQGSLDKSHEEEQKHEVATSPKDGVKGSLDKPQKEELDGDMKVSLNDSAVKGEHLEQTGNIKQTQHDSEGETGTSVSTVSNSDPSHLQKDYIVATPDKVAGASLAAPIEQASEPSTVTLPTTLERGDIRLNASPKSTAKSDATSTTAVARDIALKSNAVTAAVAKNLDAIVAITDEFRSKMKACGGAEAFLQGCRNIDEQSTPIEVSSESERDGPRERVLSGSIDMDQFVQVLEAIKLSMHVRDIEVVFNNYRSVHEVALPYEQFMCALGLVRPVNELLQVVKTSIARLCEADSGSMSCIQKYFAKMPEESSISDFRSIARTAAARVNNISADSDLYAFDRAELHEFGANLRALDVGLSDQDIERLFSAMRIVEPIKDTAILKAIEMTSNSVEERMKSQTNLLKLLEAPAFSGADVQSEQYADKTRSKSSQKKEVASANIGLRSETLLIEAFTAFFGVLKQTSLYPQPTSGLQCWAIICDLLDMERATCASDGQNAEVTSVSKSVLYQYILSKKHYALILPRSYSIVNAVLTCTDGEMSRLLQALGSVDSVSLSALFKLIGMPEKEVLLVSSLECSASLKELEVVAGQKNADMIHAEGNNLSAMLGGENSRYYFQIKGQTLGDKNQFSSDLWCEHISAPKLAEPSSSNVRFQWTKGETASPKLFALDEVAYVNPNWRLSVELCVDAGEAVAKAEVAPSSEAQATFSATIGSCKITLMQVVRQFIAQCSSESEVSAHGEVSLALPFQMSLSLTPNGAVAPVMCTLQTRVMMKTALGTFSDATVLSSYRSSEERTMHTRKSSPWIYEKAASLPNSVYLLNDLIRALLVKEPQVAEILLGDNQAAAMVKPVRPRRAARQRIERELGEKTELRGKPMMTPIAARDKVVAAWRGWKTRRYINKMRESAAVIQRVYRGYAVYAPYKQSVHLLRETHARERKHLERFRRIRSKERELTMLRRIPASDFLSYDRLRRDRSAKVVQRAWRRKAGLAERKADSRGAGKKSAAALYAEAEAAALSTEALLARQKIVDHISRCNVNKWNGSNEPQSLNLKDEPGRLAILHRRVKEAAERKALVSSLNGQTADSRLARAKLNAADGDGIDRLARQTKSNKDGVRRQYQELSEARAKLNGPLENYLLTKSACEAAQSKRLASLGATNVLLAELSRLPSLDEARERIFAAREYEIQMHRNGAGSGSINKEKASEHNEWYINLNVINNTSLFQAVDNHLLTASTMKNKARWDVVSAPHDMTGPPISVTDLSVADKENNRDSAKSRAHRQRLATAWANREDLQGSLCWVSYAAQQGKYDKTDLKELAQAEGGPDKLTSALGIVSGKELLDLLSKEASNNRNRISAVSEYCKSEEGKIDRLAAEFASQSLALLTKDRAGEIQKQLSAQEKAERNRRATQIQALARGRKDRRIAESLRSQQRVAQALSVLVAELQRPGLRPGNVGGLGLSAVALDAALIHRLGTVQAQGGAHGSSKLKPVLKTSVSKVVVSHSTDKKAEISTLRKVPVEVGSPGGRSLTLTASPRSTLHGSASHHAMSASQLDNQDLPRTPVSKRFPVRSPDSRLSAVTGVSVRESMHSMDDENDGRGGQSMASGMGYVSSPSESMSQSALSVHLFASPAVSKSARKTPNTSAPKAAHVGSVMDMVSTNYSSNRLSNVEAIVKQAQEAKLVNFKLEGGLRLLWKITAACGHNALLIATWLEKHQVNNSDGGCLDITSASLLLGELARELGLLDTGDEGTFQLIQLVLLLRLLSSCWVDNKVRIRDIFSLAEDNVFKRGDVFTAVQYRQLTQARFDIVQKSAAQGCDAKTLLSRTALALDIKLSAKLTVQDVSQLLERISPMSSESDAGNISSALADSNVSTVNSQFLAEFVMSLAVNGDGGNQTAISCTWSQLEYLLCPLSNAASFELMQGRLRAWFRAVPTLQANLLDAFSTLALTADVFTEEQVQHTLSYKTDLPINQAEARTLAHGMVAVGGVSVGGVSMFVSKVLRG